MHHTSLRGHAGWAAFKTAELLIIASALLLGRHCPLGHVTRDLAKAMDRVDPSSLL